MYVHFGAVAYRVRFSDEQLYLNRVAVDSICQHDRREILISGSMSAARLARTIASAQREIADHLGLELGGSNAPGPDGVSDPISDRHRCTPVAARDTAPHATAVTVADEELGDGISALAPDAREVLAELRAGLYRLINGSTRLEDEDERRRMAFCDHALRRLATAARSSMLALEIRSIPADHTLAVWSYTDEMPDDADASPLDLRALIDGEDARYIPSTVRAEDLDPLTRFRLLGRRAHSVLALRIDPPGSDPSRATFLALGDGDERRTWDVSLIRLAQIVGQMVSGLAGVEMPMSMAASA